MVIFKDAQHSQEYTCSNIFFTIIFVEVPSSWSNIIYVSSLDNNDVEDAVVVLDITSGDKKSTSTEFMGATLWFPITGFTKSETAFFHVE